MPCKRSRSRIDRDKDQGCKTSPVATLGDLNENRSGSGEYEHEERQLASGVTRLAYAVENGEG